MDKIVLSHYGLDPSIEVDEEHFFTFVIENKFLFYKYVTEIKNKINGDPSPNFFLRLNNNELLFDKHALAIFDIFNIDLNSKTILNLLSKKFGYFLRETNQEEKLSNIEKTIFELVDDFGFSTGLNLEYNESLNETTLVRICGLKVADDSLSLLERIFNYIDLYSELLPIKVFFLVFGKEFFSDDEIFQIYNHCYDKQLRFIIIENFDHSPLSLNENRLIIDTDQCVITQNS